MIKFLVYQQGLWGAEFRTLGPMASIKPTVVENSQLFAQRTVRPHCRTKWRGHVLFSFARQVPTG